jgi:hypothetical protein
VNFKQASDGISRNEIVEIMNYFGIPTKVVRAKAYVQIQNDITSETRRWASPCPI